jgi:K(+)-stimulated pyrophosphate-energized sodium pump
MDPKLSLIYMISFFFVTIAFAFAVFLLVWVKKQKNENKKIQEVSALIKAGANTFMKKEYKVLAIFAGV